MSSRPMFLNLTQMHFPVTALVSIAHRVTGVILFLGLPWLLYLLSHSLASAEAWRACQLMLHRGLGRLAISILLWSAGFHALAGLRHLCMDMGLGGHLSSAIRSAWLVFLLTILWVIGIGVWLW